MQYIIGNKFVCGSTNENKTKQMCVFLIKELHLFKLGNMDGRGHFYTV